MFNTFKSNKMTFELKSMLFNANFNVALYINPASGLFCPWKGCQCNPADRPVDAGGHSVSCWSRQLLEIAEADSLLGFLRDQFVSHGNLKSKLKIPRDKSNDKVRYSVTCQLDLTLPWLTHWSRRNPSELQASAISRNCQLQQLIESLPASAGRSAELQWHSFRKFKINFGFQSYPKLNLAQFHIYSNSYQLKNQNSPNWIQTKVWGNCKKQSYFQFLTYKWYVANVKKSKTSEHKWYSNRFAFAAYHS